MGYAPRPDPTVRGSALPSSAAARGVGVALGWTDGRTDRACKSPDTLLDKDQSTRLYVLRCQQCGAGRSVTAMKQGFVAQIGRRKKVG